MILSPVRICRVLLVGLASLLIEAGVARAAEASVVTPGFRQAAPGPWGRIEWQTIYLTAPEAILEEFPTPNPQPRWCFAASTAAAVRGVLSAAGVADEMRDRLFADPRAKRDAEGVFSLFPTGADVESLKPAVRAALYRELAKYPINSFHHEPTCVPDGDVDAWLRGTGLPDHIVKLIGDLTWRDGDALLFSDYRTLISKAGSDAEARRWVRVLTRTRAIVAWLRVDESDDLTALRRYWSANYHRKDSLPILTAAADAPGGSRLDLSHLLPPLPRRLAYAYTTPELDRSGQSPNCHWTSLNFFNYTPQNVYLDLRLAASQVLEGYDRVTGAATFGDVLFFLDEKGNAFHSVVYLADDLVFSKNGGNTVMPWIITRLGDLKQLYLHGKPEASIATFRRHWPGEGE